ncbi:hypothetical protein PU629_12130 [Pullulanibacillus sp. KACC 23026]|uniref:hypothetical protein n=1 Tax=Pullulanibacillus sp. KACC 23026 TaxID=3028315 RepID=UPI0023B1903F|nr:hypothetical protein [Pullulanibacillus sp. KACC 23026]WEG10925.1 hypothetical protein PU629_12130 [Pullulanibacillus sp. KACC 23026]
MTDHRDIVLQAVQDTMDEAGEVMKRWGQYEGAPSFNKNRVKEELDRTQMKLQHSYELVHLLCAEGKASFQDFYQLQTVIQQVSRARHQVEKMDQTM